ncbi:glycosyltransferase [Methylobacter sp.]|uniref:glycosyltransferase n=1 Tax=Methylobacter sp. TaxID=2051955 RepID=UPI003DA63430
MIFVTVGSQLPFDRLIRAMDGWASENSAQPVFAQIGVSQYQPMHMGYCQTMTPDEYQDYLQKADLIVAHAGMGTIISALELGKPLLLMPRLASKGEHRNDHQLATAQRFSKFLNIKVANDESELLLVINQLLNSTSEKFNKVETEVSPNLISVIKQFVKNC